MFEELLGSVGSKGSVLDEFFFSLFDIQFPLLVLSWLYKIRGISVEMDALKTILIYFL